MLIVSIRIPRGGTTCIPRNANEGLQQMPAVQQNPRGGFGQFIQDKRTGNIQPLGQNYASSESTHNGLGNDPGNSFG